MQLIAIDGPAGSGKSTVARAVAARLGLDYLDTGAMYRSVAYAVLKRGVDSADAAAVAALARALDITVAGTVMVDGDDATQAIRGKDVSALVSTVAAYPEVRADMVRRQRAWATHRDGGVVEGRDIGTIVFPDAQLKVFLTASESERVRRRAIEAGNDVAAEVVRRDRIDSSRSVSPLVAADDALVIDTTGRAVEDVVDEVLAKL
jgi:cytidylate kinase